MTDLKTYHIQIKDKNNLIYSIEAADPDTATQKAAKMFNSIFAHAPQEIVNLGEVAYIKPDKK